MTIGGTFPLTGPAQLYGVIPKAENAYFQYVNAHGGVNGRKINFKVYDDGYNPAQTVPLTKKLVQQDHVFAVYGSLGTAPILATRDYLNKLKVPQVLKALRPQGCRCLCWRRAWPRWTTRSAPG